MGADLAISTKESSDYTCTAVIGVDQTNGDCYILDLSRSRITFPQQLDLIKRKANEYQPAIIGLESVSYQAALPQMLRKETNLPIREVKPFRDKVTRITSRFVMFENGKVFLPRNHPELEHFIDEYIYFPKGKHDDLLDAVEIALSLASTAAILILSQISIMRVVGIIGSFWLVIRLGIGSGERGEILRGSYPLICRVGDYHGRFFLLTVRNWRPWTGCQVGKELPGIIRSVKKR